MTVFYLQHYCFTIRNQTSSIRTFVYHSQNQHLCHCRRAYQYLNYTKPLTVSFFMFMNQIVFYNSQEVSKFITKQNSYDQHFKNHTSRFQHLCHSGAKTCIKILGKSKQNQCSHIDDAQLQYHQNHLNCLSPNCILLVQKTK